jgi:membrane fusion protein (multidrug efflux system)
MAPLGATAPSGVAAQPEGGALPGAPTHAELESVLLKYDRRWVHLAYLGTFLTAVTLFAFSCVVSVKEYATGVAVVRVDGKRAVTAPAGGIVEAFAVRPGQTVKQGELLVRLHDADEVAELKRVRADYEQQLTQLMLNPLDTNAKAQLASLHATQEKASSRLAERWIRAPISGIVSDVRTRPGQRIEVGEVLLGVAPPDSQVSIVAVLPGDYRPMLLAQQPVRFSLDGYAYEYHDLTVESVGEGVVGPSEVRRFLGQEIFDSVHMTQGAKVLVTARLDKRTFTSEGQTYAFFDGLTGTADVPVREEPIIVTLLPFVKAVLGR